MPPVLPTNEDILKRVSLSKGTVVSTPSVLPAHGDIVAALPAPGLVKTIAGAAFGTPETNQPGNPDRGGLIGQTIRKAFEDEGERKRTQTLGEDFITTFIERPAKMLKAVTVDLPRMVVGGLSAVGKSVLEEVYTNERSGFAKGARALGLDTTPAGVRRGLSHSEDEKKLFKFETDSWQSIKDKIDQLTASSPLATDWEKQHLGKYLSIAGFMADSYFGPPGKGKITSEILKELIESTTDDVARATMLKAGIPNELATAAARGVAKARTAQEVEIAIKGEAAKVLKEAAESATEQPKLFGEVVDVAKTAEPTVTREVAPVTTEVAISKELEPLVQKAKLYQTVEEFAADLSEKDYRQFLNQITDPTTGERINSATGRKLGSVSKPYGDYLYKNDRDMFNNQLLNIKSGQDLPADLIDLYKKATKKEANLAELADNFDPYKVKKITLEVDNPRAKEILAQRGIEASTFKHEVDSYAIKHALKEHGEDELPLIRDDLNLIPEVIREADTIDYVGKTKQGLDTLKYAKKYNGTTYYVEEVRTGAGTLSMKTMYKSPTPGTSPVIRPEAVRSPDEPAPIPREGELDTASNTINKTEEKSSSDQPKLFTEEDSFEINAKEEAGSEYALKRSAVEEEKVVSNLQTVFAEMKGVSVEDLKVKFSEEEISRAELEYQFVVDSLVDDPARALVKYTSKTTGKLPDVTGTDTIRSLKDGKTVVKNSEFGRRGDDLVTELGFNTPEEAQKALDGYLVRRAKAAEWFEKVREIHKNIRLAKQADNFIGKEKDRLAREVATNMKGLRDLVQAAERAGFRKGFSEGNKRYSGLVERLKGRRSKINAIQDALNLTDAEMKKARGFKDPRFMTDKEFDSYLEGVRKGAEHIHKRNEERLLVETIIKERDLKRTENLQKALQFPTINNMSYEQLVEFGDILAKTAPGDTFLGPRMIQTAVNTDLGNIKTIGEGIAAVAKQTGMPYVDPVEGSELDRWMRDPTLVEKDPLHKLFITEWVAKEADMLTKEHALKKELNKLAGAARKARFAADARLRKQGKIKQSIRDRIFAHLAPEDKLVVQWLQPFEVTYTEDGHKTINRLPELRARAEVAMTSEELAYAKFLEKFFSHYYDIAEAEAKTRWTLQGVKHTNYRQIYYTHMNRAFFERWRDDSFVKALKMAWGKNVAETTIDFSAFGDRGEVLGMEKWLNRAMTREGEGIDKETGHVLYTQNTAKVAVAYFHAFERKLNLDAMAPKIKLLEFIMGKRFQTPKSINNPEGTEQVHSVLRKSLNEWINNKKGQRVEMVYKQGARVEAFVDTASLLISLFDLGGNIVTQTASAVGGELMTLRGAKFKGWARGHKRSLTKQGRQIGRDYAGVIGDSPWFNLASVTNDAGDTLVSGLFYVFADLSYRSRRQMLLGLLTKEEFETGVITSKRQAEIKLEIGKWHPLPEFRSVAGSTSFIKMGSKYMEWATPGFQKSTQDLSKLIKEMRRLSGDESKFKAFVTSNHFKELFLTTLVGIGAYVAGQLIFQPDQEDQSFAGQLKNKAAREAGSIIQAVTGVGIFFNVRMLGFMEDLGKAVATLVLWEKYETAGPGHAKGDFKFPGAFGKVLIPNSIEPFLPEKETPLKTIQEIKSEIVRGNTFFTLSEKRTGSSQG